MAVQGTKVVWSEITNIIARINLARSKHGLASINYSTTAKVQASTMNSLINDLVATNNAIIGGSSVSLSTLVARTANVNPIDDIDFNNLFNKATEVYNHCSCVAACSCNCNYCSCNCDRCSCDCDYCSCDCDYCACDCDRCACNCDRCSCDCDYCSCDTRCACNCDRCSCNCYNCPQCPQCPNCPNT